MIKVSSVNPKSDDIHIWRNVYLDRFTPKFEQINFSIKENFSSKFGMTGW